MTKCALNEYKHNSCDTCATACAHKIILTAKQAEANVPPEYRKLNVLNSPARTAQAKIYADMAHYVKLLSNPDHPHKSLYFVSPQPGNGKSTTAIAILNEYLMRNLTNTSASAFFLDVNAWQTLFLTYSRSGVPADVAEKASREYYRQMQRAKSAYFVVMDDIGVRSATDAFRADLHDIINYRNVRQYPTIYTSNVTAEQLATIFDNRLADRVNDLCLTYAFGGGSKRGKRTV